MLAYCKALKLSPSSGRPQPAQLMGTGRRECLAGDQWSVRWGLVTEAWTVVCWPPGQQSIS